ncbi:MAG: hypothetical protein K2X47_14950, partial [Bdellovibrionales bacterium]|nr:hypothetical protein [Bdellovibrionales bacterium]
YVTGYILRQMRSIQTEGKVWKFKIFTNEIQVNPDQTTSENPYIDEIVAEVQADEQGTQSDRSSITPLFFDSRGNTKLQTLIEKWRSTSVRPFSSASSGFSPCLPVSSEMLKYLGPGYHVTYHSLGVSELDQDPPKLVQRASNCQGLANCKIKVRRVVYDEALRHEMGGVERYRCEFEFSDDVPYLGQMAKRCLNFMAKIEDRDIPLTLCLTLANFEHGKAPGTPATPPTTTTTTTINP